MNQQEYNHISGTVLSFPKKPIRALSINPSNTHILAGGSETLRLIELQSDKPSKFIVRPNGRSVKKQHIVSLDWNTKTDQVASASLTGNIAIWDISGRGIIPANIFDHFNSAANKVQWNPFSLTTLASGYQDGKLRFWDSRQKSMTSEIIKKDSIRDVKFAPLKENLLLISYLRNPESELFSVNAHRNIVSALDWNPIHPLNFASGSMDKELKIWQISPNLRIVDPIQKIQNLAGINQVKWSKSNPSFLYLASFTLDNGISVWSVQNPFHAQRVFRGHRDNVNDFVVCESKQFLVSSAKDCSVIWQDFDQSFDYYNFVNKNAFGFLNNDVLAFRNESYEAKLWPEIDIKKDDLIKIKNEETKFIQFLPFNNVFEDKKTMQFHDEIDFFLKNYKLNDCGKESLHYNSKLAKTNGKNSVSEVWKTLLYICGVSSPTIRKHGSDNYPALETIENVKNNDFVIEQLYNIFIDFEEKIGKEIENKSIIFEENDGELLIKKSRLNEIIAWKGFENLKSSESLPDDSINNTMVNNVIVETLQELIDAGEIFHAFCMFISIRHRVVLTEKIERSWTNAFIEIIRNQGFHCYATKCLRNSNVVEIRNITKKSTNLCFICENCRKTLENTQKNRCENCKKIVRCSVCNLPLRGLSMLCQYCNHTGHLKCVTNWFKIKNECPGGCKHKCFYL